MTDKIRREFEAWFASRGGAYPIRQYWIEASELYVDDSAQSLWAAWKASRDALTVVLPPACEDDLTLIAAIEEAGVSVKLSSDPFRSAE